MTNKNFILFYYRFMIVVRGLILNIHYKVRIETSSLEVILNSQWNTFLKVLLKSNMHA